MAWCAAIAAGIVPGATDAAGWYRTILPDPYEIANYSLGHGFFFAPPIAYLIFPLQLLPLPVYLAAMTGASLVALAYLAGRWAAFALLVPFVWWEISSSNVNLLIAAAVVAGLRWPAAWSFVLLTKVTPGVGLVWFAVRREWRPLAIALGATAAVSAVSFVIAPGLWFTWVDRLTSNAGASGPGFFTVDIPLTIRLAMALAIVTWGALTDRRWTVVVAATLAMPVLWWNALSMLVAVVPLIDVTATRARPPAASVGGSRQAPARTV